MLEVKFIAGEILFSVVGARIEKHTCMGAFEAEGRISYVITPYGKLATLTEHTIFKTFDEAKAHLTELSENTIKVAEEQLKGIKLISESDVEELPNKTPTEEELVADEQAVAEAQSEAESDPQPENVG